MLKRPPLSPELNRAIMLLAPAFEARDIAPSTYGEMLQAPRGLVWSGASDQTVYGDPVVNHAFRAWHDWHHAEHGFDFSRRGEHLTCLAQLAELRLVFPRAPKLWHDIIRAEIDGQGAFVDATGHFPVDQYEFTRRFVGL